MKVVSPVFGKIEHIDYENHVIYIYISQKDNHRIFAPISGKISEMSYETGKLYDAPKIEGVVFKAQPRKTGRLHLVIENKVYVIVEVGHEKYITDTVEMYEKEGDKIIQSDEIGRIILGSRCFIQSNFRISSSCKVGDKLIGGQTILFR